MGLLSACAKHTWTASCRTSRITRNFSWAGLNEKALNGCVDPKQLPAWLRPEDLDYYANECSRTGFRRGLFLRYVDEEDIRNFLAALTREAEWVEVDVRISACRDPKDDKFLEVAVSGRATHIVTGDSDLLALNPFRGIEFLPPHRFL